MTVTLSKWEMTHYGGLSAIFRDELTDINNWCLLDGDEITLEQFVTFLTWKFGGVLILNYQAASLASMTKIWHLSSHYKFSGLAATMRLTYNPISNYDRTESETTARTPNLTKTETRNTQTADGGTTATSGTTTDSQSAGATGSVAPFDSAVFANAQKSETTAGGTSTDSQTVTHGKTTSNTGTVTNTETGNDTTGRQLHVSGNIGVMSTQDMILQERQVVNFELLELYCKEWVNSVTCGVWSLGSDTLYED